MQVSEARLTANRMNAAKSCGPRTPEGKERSRANGLKHGLAGAGVVVPAGDAEEIARRSEALEADLKPRSAAGLILIGRMAMLSVRMERAGDREILAIRMKVRHAVDDFDEERLDEADRLFDALHEDPRKNLRKLKKSSEGVDRLLGAWRDLRDDLARDIPRCWTAAHLEQAAHMTGLRGEKARDSRIGALSRGIWGDFDLLGAREGGDLGEEARQGWAKARLIERIAAEIAALEAHHETLDFETIELDRLEAPGRALFDTSQPATLARRYESEASRGFFKALKEFRQVEAEFAAQAEEFANLPTPPPAPSNWLEPDSRMGSSRETTPPAPLEAAWDFLDAPIHRAPVVRGPDGQPLTIGRTPKTPG